MIGKTVLADSVLEATEVSYNGSEHGAFSGSQAREGGIKSGSSDARLPPAASKNVRRTCPNSSVTTMLLHGLEGAYCGHAIPLAQLRTYPPSAHSSDAKQSLASHGTGKCCDSESYVLTLTFRIRRPRIPYKCTHKTPDIFCTLILPGKCASRIFNLV